MVQEEYVSLQTAKLLKEKGFKDEYTYGYYSPDGELKFVQCFGDASDFFMNEESCISAPSQALAMRWLREEKGIIILISTGRKDGKKTGHSFWFGIEDNDMNSLCDSVEYAFNYCADTYEEACEEAILYCLTNLI